jgi:hypothetical protein
MLKGGFPVSLDEEGRECTPKKPDIVMIEKKRPGGRGKGTIRISEVTYGWAPNWEKKVELKERKYGPLVKALEEAKWEMSCSVVVVGVTGMSRRTFGEEDRKGYGITIQRCMELDGRIAQHTWESARGAWRTRYVEVAEIRARSGVEGEIGDAPT